MLTFLATFVIIALAVLAMAVGVLMGRRPITGSCGGLNRAIPGMSCLFCTRPCERARRGSGARSAESTQ